MGCIHRTVAAPACICVNGRVDCASPDALAYCQCSQNDAGNLDFFFYALRERFQKPREYPCHCAQVFLHGNKIKEKRENAPAVRKTCV